MTIHAAPAPAATRIPPGRRWVVFAAAFAIIFVIAGVAIWSVFGKPLEAVHPELSAEVRGNAYTIYTFALAFCGIFSGRFADRYGSRPLMIGGGLLFGAGWALTGIADSPIALYLVFGLMAGGGCGIVYNPCLATALRWFPDIRGKASGILLASAAIGPAILSPLASGLSAGALGPQGTLVAFGLGYATICVLLGWLIVAPPQGWVPAGWEPTPGQAAAAGGQTDWSRMLRQPVFWLLFVTFAFAATSGTMMVSSLSSIAQFQLKVAFGGDAAALAAFGALAVSISTLSNFVGRISIGTLFDKVGGATSLFVIFAMTILAMLGLALFGGNVVAFVASVIVLGFAFGGVLVVFPPLTGSTFGMANLGTNYGIMFVGYAVGGFIGPRLATSLFSADTGYLRTYIGAIVIGLLGVGTTALLRRVSAGPVAASDQHNTTASSRKG